MKPTFLEPIALCMNMVGSRYTVDPPPTDTDEDWLVLIPEKNFKDGRAVQLLDENRFGLDNPSAHYRADEGLFNSWRGPENTNILITANRDFHNRFLAATSLAKKYNLKTRPERVELFQAVLYGAILDRGQFAAENGALADLLRHQCNGKGHPLLTPDEDLPY